MGPDAQNLVSDCPLPLRTSHRKQCSLPTHADGPFCSCLPAPRLMAPIGRFHSLFSAVNSPTRLLAQESQADPGHSQLCPFTLAGLCSHPQLCPEISTPGPLHCCPWHGHASSCGHLFLEAAFAFEIPPTHSSTSLEPTVRTDGEVAPHIEN